MGNAFFTYTHLSHYEYRTIRLCQFLNTRGKPAPNVIAYKMAWKNVVFPADHRLEGSTLYPALEDSSVEVYYFTDQVSYERQGKIRILPQELLEILGGDFHYLAIIVGNQLRVGRPGTTGEKIDLAEDISRPQCVYRDLFVFVIEKDQACFTGNNEADLFAPIACAHYLLS
jgi:hypothetical protein